MMQCRAVRSQARNRFCGALVHVRELGGWARSVLNETVGPQDMSSSGCESGKARNDENGEECHIISIAFLSCHVRRLPILKLAKRSRRRKVKRCIYSQSLPDHSASRYITTILASINLHTRSTLTSASDSPSYYYSHSQH